jgi:hypothetical protein
MLLALYESSVFTLPRFVTVSQLSEASAVVLERLLITS